MTPRLFLRLVQPTRALTFALLLSGCALPQARGFFHLAWPREALFVTCAVTLPLLAGAALTGLLHAVLHRPHALLLPDLLPQLRRAAAVAYLALAAVITLACKVAESDAPAVGVFGLALGLLTLSCANRRLGFPRLKWLGLLSGSLTVAVAWLVFHLRFAHDLLPAMQAAPWAFLAGGGVIAATTFSLGFSRRTLRQRATTPYFAAGYNWTAFLDQSALRRQLKEQEQFNASRGLAPKPRSSRHWPLRTVGPRVRDWLRVLDHQQAIPAAKARAIHAVTIASGLAGAFGLLGLFEFRNGPYWPGLWNAFAQVTGDPAQMGQFARISLSVIAIGFYPTPGLTPSRPVLYYPVSRTRLADLMFLQLIRNLTIDFTFQLLAYWACSLAGQFFVDRFNALLGFPAIVVCWLALSPFIALSAVSDFGPRRIHAFGLRFVIVCSAVVFVQFARLNWSAFILSPAGIALSLLATLGTLALLRWRIQRHYRTCDLTHEAAWATPFGAAGASGR